MLPSLNKAFKIYQNQLNESAHKYGINNFFTYTSKHLKKTAFYKQNNEIFSFSRRYRYWLWKPYYILEALHSVNYSYIIFYADSGCIFIDDPKEHIDMCKKNASGTVPFSDPYLFKNDMLNTLNMPPHYMGLWNEAAFKNLTKIFPLKLDKIVIENLPEAGYDLDRFYEVNKDVLYKPSYPFKSLLINCIIST